MSYNLRYYSQKILHFNCVQFACFLGDGPLNGGPVSQPANTGALSELQDCRPLRRGPQPPGLARLQAPPEGPPAPQPGQTAGPSGGAPSPPAWPDYRPLRRGPEPPSLARLQAPPGGPLGLASASSAGPAVFRPRRAGPWTHNNDKVYNFMSQRNTKRLSF